MAKLQDARPVARILVILGAAGATTLVAGSVSAQPDPGLRPQGEDSLLHPAQPFERLGRFAVREQFSYALPGRCQYVGSVYGQVREVRDRNESRRDERHYRPSLWVKTVVHCTDSVDRVARRQLVGWARDLAQLETMIEKATRVTVLEGARTCNYAPNVRILPGGLVRSDHLVQSCTARTSEVQSPVSGL